MYDEHLPAIALQDLFDLPKGGDNTIDLWAPSVRYEEDFRFRMLFFPLASLARPTTHPPNSLRAVHCPRRFSGATSCRLHRESSGADEKMAFMLKLSLWPLALQ